MYTARDVFSAAISDVTTITTIVPAKTGKKAVIVGLQLSLDTAGEIIIHSDNGASADVALTGLIELAADTPFVLPTSYIPYAVGVLSEELVLTSTTAANGFVQYAYIDDIAGTT